MRRFNRGESFAWRVAKGSVGKRVLRSWLHIALTCTPRRTMLLETGMEDSLTMRLGSVMCMASRVEWREGGIAEGRERRWSIRRAS